MYSCKSFAEIKAREETHKKLCIQWVNTWGGGLVKTHKNAQTVNYVCIINYTKKQEALLHGCSPATSRNYNSFPQGDKMALERAYLAGVDMNMGDYDRRTALHLACAENHPACVKYLIETCQVSENSEAKKTSIPAVLLRV